MKLLNKKQFFRNITILISIITVAFILWNTSIFLQKFKEEERSKMEIYASAIEEMTSNPNLNDNFNLVTEIYKHTDGIPSILTDKDGSILAFNNLDSTKVADKMYLSEQLEIMKSQNTPIKTSQNQFVYYRNSDLLETLKYSPITLVLILALFITIVYLFFNSTKVAEQNRLWTGMAKETAHQIGTPLSSLMGWLTILEGENINPLYVDEIQKDIDRLDVITNRFSKIGAIPKLKAENIVELCKKTFIYLEARSSKQVHFSFESSLPEISVKLDKDLIGWVIENLTKNAIDAMKGKGKISLHITTLNKGVRINISDTGKGIPKSMKKTIFDAGFTTKKRGWGLGLSLSKRIIKDYHNGKIFVKKSEINKGTTFEIILNF